MSDHGIGFLDLRDCPREDQFERLEEEVRLLSEECTLVVVMDHRPNPYFEKLTEVEDPGPGMTYCFNEYQASPEVCVGSITISERKKQSSQYEGPYASIFTGLPLKTD